MSERPKCIICGEPMPEGEEMFKYHGYSGNCPKPPLPKSDTPRTDIAALGFARILVDRETWTHTELVDANFARQLEYELRVAQSQLESFKQLHASESQWRQSAEADSKKYMRLMEAAKHMVQEANDRGRIVPGTVSLHSVRMVCEAFRDLNKGNKG